MCWTGGGGTIGVVSFLKALLLELVSTMMSLPVVNLRFSAPGRREEVGLPREVGAAALGRGSATITRDESPFFGVWFFAWECGKHRGRGVGPWQEVGAALLELGNDDLLWPLASDPLVFGIARRLGSALGSRSCWLLCNHARQR